MVFDAGGKNFRHRLYPEYKANRPPTPDDLSVQFPLTREVCKVLGLAIVEIRGVEADDIVGTLAARAEREGYRVFVVSSDKDFLQLVSERVTVINPGKELRYDPGLVTEKFGVAPENVTDVLGLVGDSVDNVPGVPGIGMKGAVSLIREWGSVESALENAAKISNKRQREALLQHAEQARLSKKLVRLDTNIALEIGSDELRYRGADRKAAFELFDRLGFTSLLNEYLPETSSAPPGSYLLLSSPAELKGLMDTATKRNRLALSLLTAENKASGGLLGVGLAVDPGKAFFVPVGGKWTEEGILSELARVVSDRSVLKVGHDLKRAKLWFARRGVDLCGIGFDSMVASYVLNPSKRTQRPGNTVGRDTSEAHQRVEIRCRQASGAPGFGRCRRSAYRTRDPAQRGASRRGSSDSGKARATNRRRGVGDGFSRVRATSHRDPGGHGEGGHSARRGPAPRHVPRGREGAGRAYRGNLRAGRCRVQHQLPEAAGRDPLREDETSIVPQDAEAALRVDQDGSAGRARSSFRAPSQDPRLSESGQVEGNLHRCTARASRSPDRPHPHIVQPNGCRDGSFVELGSEPSEHSDPKPELGQRAFAALL